MVSKRTFTVLGPSDTHKLQHIADPIHYKTWLEELCRVCASHFDQLLFIPDHGTYVDFALEYLRLRGPEHVTAVAPNHEAGLVERARLMGVEQFRQMEQGAGWTYLNTHFVGLAPFSVCLGYSAGSILELAASKYLRAYDNKPTHFFIDRRSVSAELPRELAEDIAGIDYFNSADHLNELLSNNV